MSSTAARQLATVHFSNELRDWIVNALRRGGQPDEIVRALAAQRFDAGVARDLVDAFGRVLREGGAMPEGSLTIARQAPQPAAPRLPRATVLHGGDRNVSVLTRHDKPVVAVLEAVLTHAECDSLIAAARPRLAASTITDPQTGEQVVSPDRTSRGMFFRLAETPLLARLDARISALMQMPVAHGEGLQVLHYTAGAQSRPHFDFLMPNNAANQASIARSGQRVSTLVIYLNEVAEGGETVFPEIGLSVVPRKGNAVYFEYCDSQGQLDGRTLHAAAEVMRGEKWVATKWMRERMFVAAQG
ncbi:2OG-Fe(II) oxygenase [Cupriavidus agavae]|uniref:Prolyl 4-hydroxylase n=1 Tax=Cupriavidus agavae TaxID=1001822 RepID=A0A4Q7S9J1_9BURK|nr:2OG-Fe(II) oxygenase [Cupriavidus agavae]RZT42470.1 prolyl 4-hydroxylase [Cupriavidus agavae]